MSSFENNVSSRMLPQIDATYSQVMLEPLYRGYALQLAKLAKKLGATKAPAACAALRVRLTAYAGKVAAATKTLGEGTELTQRQFSELLRKQGVKLSKYGRKLTALTANLHC